MNDAHWMQRCIDLARRAEGRTAPNPMVGAVLVKDGRVLGEGWHRVAGEPHAESLALNGVTQAWPAPGQRNSSMRTEPMYSPIRGRLPTRRSISVRSRRGTRCWAWI